MLHATRRSSVLRGRQYIVPLPLLQSVICRVNKAYRACMLSAQDQRLAIGCYSEFGRRVHDVHAKGRGRERERERERLRGGSAQLCGSFWLQVCQDHLNIFALWAK